MPVGGGKFKGSAHMSPVAEEAVWKERIGKLNISLSRQPTASFNINPYVSPQSKHDRCSPVADPIGRRKPTGRLPSSSPSTYYITSTSNIPSTSVAAPKPRKHISKADRILSETITKADVGGITWQHVKQPVFTSDLKILTGGSRGQAPVNQNEDDDVEDNIVDYCTTFRILKTAAKSASAKICGGGGADRGAPGGNKNISGGAMLGADTDTTNHDVLAEQVHLVNSLLNNHHTNTSSTSHRINSRSDMGASSVPASTSLSSRVTKADIRWARGQLGLNGRSPTTAPFSNNINKDGSTMSAPVTPTSNNTITTAQKARGTTTISTNLTSSIRSCMSPLGFSTTAGGDEDGSETEESRRKNAYIPHDASRLEKAKEAILNARARLPQERHAVPVTSAMSVGWVEGGVAKKRSPGPSHQTTTQSNNMAVLDGAATFTIADKRALRNVLRGYDEDEALQEQRDRAAQQRASSAMMFENANLDKMNDGSPARNRLSNITQPLTVDGSVPDAGVASLQRMHVSRGPSPVPTTGHLSYQSAAAAARQKINADRSNAFTLAPSGDQTTKPPKVPPTAPPHRASTSLAYSSPSAAAAADNDKNSQVDQGRLWSVTPQPTANAHRSQKYLHFNKDKKLSEITQFSCRTGLFDGLTKSSKMKS